LVRVDIQLGLEGLRLAGIAGLRVRPSGERLRRGPPDAFAMDLKCDHCQ
jgi:hypothetical protein